MKIQLGYIIMLASCLMAGCEKSELDKESARMMSMYGENLPLPARDSTVSYSVKTYNGYYIGKATDSVLSYKGIPYAQPPVGRLRWHAPEAAPASSDVWQAYYFGKSAIQSKDLGCLGSLYPQSEDCLTLNVWTAQSDSASLGNRPVMVYIHGGSYGWGGSSDPMFDGHNLVKAHPDIILVTINYRLGIFGFLDLSTLKGGEDYEESANLGLLDQIEALKWVRKNIAAFGGNPDNVTIFGESAGGGSVSLLPLIDRSKGLFRRVIAESGSVALTSSRKQAEELTDLVVKETGIDNVEGLMELSQEQLAELSRKVEAHNRFPMRDGKLIPLDPYRAYREGKARDIDFMTGTNSDEANYWIGGMGGIIPFKIAINVWYENIMEGLPQAEREACDRFTDDYSKGRTWGRVEFITDLMFRIPSTFTARCHAESGGRTYNYYWTKASALPHRGACHTVELPYVFGNLNENRYTGNNIDPKLSATVQEMWTNFARTGDPSLPGQIWPEYNDSTRKTMVIDDTLKVESDILGNQYAVIAPLADLYISPLHDNISLNVPYVHVMAGWVLLSLAVIIVIVVIIRKSVRKCKRNQRSDMAS